MLKRIILSHSRIFEDVAKAEERAEKEKLLRKQLRKRNQLLQSRTKLLLLHWVILMHLLL